MPCFTPVHISNRRQDVNPPQTSVPSPGPALLAAVPSWQAKALQPDAHHTRKTHGALLTYLTSYRKKLKKGG